MFDGAIALAVQNKAAALTVAFITSGIGINIILRLINKIPLQKLYDIVEASSKTVSQMGNLKFTRPLWEPVETFIQGALKGVLDAVNRGLDYDDAEPTKQEAGDNEKPN